jgi:hypothetical protein
MIKRKREKEKFLKEEENRKEGKLDYERRIKHCKRSEKSV